VRRTTGSEKVQVCSTDEQPLQDVGFKDAGNAEQVVNEYFNQHFPNAVSDMVRAASTGQLSAHCLYTRPDVVTILTCRWRLPLKSAASKGDSFAT
jgi:hypothetical protein